MSKIVGVDFSAIGKYRTNVSVRMPNGDEVELPLIKMRDAKYAMILLQRNDLIAAQFNTTVERLQFKSQSLTDVHKALHDDNSLSGDDNTQKAIDDAYDAIGNAQKKINELQLQSHSLCDEIHEFLKPYLQGTGIIEQLKILDDVYTMHVLQLMLDGGAEDSDTDNCKDDTQENPMTPQSQNS
jgi:hypothetical protein